MRVSPQKTESHVCSEITSSPHSGSPRVLQRMSSRAVGWERSTDFHRCTVLNGSGAILFAQGCQASGGDVGLDDGDRAQFPERPFQIGLLRSDQREDWRRGSLRRSRACQAQTSFRIGREVNHRQAPGSLLPGCRDIGGFPAGTNPDIPAVKMPFDARFPAAGSLKNHNPGDKHHSIRYRPHYSSESGTWSRIIAREGLPGQCSACMRFPCAI